VYEKSRSSNVYRSTKTGFKRSDSLFFLPQEGHFVVYYSRTYYKAVRVGREG
jgi:hypothetical protein